MELLLMLDAARGASAAQITTNTLPLAPDKQLPNLKTRSVAPLFAEAIRRIHLGESVSSLFGPLPTHG